MTKTVYKNIDFILLLFSIPKQKRSRAIVSVFGIGGINCNGCVGTHPKRGG